MGHFYAQGASPVKGKCPLWSDNINLHKSEVLKAAEVAKKDVGLKTLKYDPSKDMDKPPEGFDPKALHAPGDYEEEDSDEEDDDDDFIDDDDDHWDYRRGRRIYDDFIVLDDEDDDEYGDYR